MSRFNLRSNIGFRSKESLDIVGYLDEGVEFEPSKNLLERRQYLRKETDRRRTFFKIQKIIGKVSFFKDRDNQQTSDPFEAFDELPIIQQANDHREWDLKKQDQ